MMALYFSQLFPSHPIPSRKRKKVSLCCLFQSITNKVLCCRRRYEYLSRVA
jgi:hypothetical protein